MTADRDALQSKLALAKQTLEQSEAHMRALEQAAVQHTTAQSESVAALTARTTELEQKLADTQTAAVTAWEQSAAQRQQLEAQLQAARAQLEHATQSASASAAGAGSELAAAREQLAKTQSELQEVLSYTQLLLLLV